MGTMLKLTMNPRKRFNKRMRAYLTKLRLQGSQGMLEMENKTMEQRLMIMQSLQALLDQERSGAYSCVDYLSLTVWQQNIYDLLPKGRLQNVQHPGDSHIDEYCREQIVEWSFRVVDYFRIDREVVALSLSLLDRFLAICECDRSSFKLAATTTLHLAVKLLHPCKLGELGILSFEVTGVETTSTDTHFICHTLVGFRFQPSELGFVIIRH
jgi:hypothetical protein